MTFGIRSSFDCFVMKSQVAVCPEYAASRPITAMSELSAV